MSNGEYDIKRFIEEGKASLGIELGSTRIKAVLIGKNNEPIASGNHDWENRFENNIWTYSLEDIWTGLQSSYTNLAADVSTKYRATLTRPAAIGISAMMHGYMPFDDQGELLTPFRTWRNTMTEAASYSLSELFDFNIPQRWSIAHLYQAVLNKEEHVRNIDFITTLAGYIHWKLTGNKVVGIGEASGMFPINSATHDYNAVMLDKFAGLPEVADYPWDIRKILPKVLVAGENAGTLTAEGAALLDVSGKLEAGIPFCPPEGDAGTGMTATNSVAKRTGNVSAGTSVFAMVVLEEELSKRHPEIDMVTTPSGDPVGMAHCNNCTSDLNAWVSLFREFADCFGIELDTNTLFTKLFNKALEGDDDCGNMLAYNYLSGEHITGFEEGRPLFVRTPDSKFSLANFMKLHLYTALGALKTGLDILLEEENVKLDRIYGHGGLFKTKGVGQSILAAAINTPVSVMETAGEGGAWGIALLASYMINKLDAESLGDYLDIRVFSGQSGSELQPVEKDVKAYKTFIEKYKSGLAIERAAIENFTIRN